MDVARIGLAHDGLDTALERYRRIRAASGRPRPEVGILVDLPGPRSAPGTSPTRACCWPRATAVRLHARAPTRAPTEVIQVDYLELLNDIHHGDTLGFGDGAVWSRSSATPATPSRSGSSTVACVTGRPGVHIPSDRLRIATPTAEDLVMLDAFIEAGVDMVAVSFVRSAHDVRRVGVEPHPRGPLVVAKIETRAAVDNLDGIIEASGASHGGPRRSRHRSSPSRSCRTSRSASSSKCISLGRPDHHRHPDARVDGPRADAHPGRGLRRRQRGVRRLLGADALGRDGHGRRPGQRGGHHGRGSRRGPTTMFDYSGWARDLSETHMTSIDRLRRRHHRRHEHGRLARRARDQRHAIICLTSTGFTVRSIARFRPEARILAFSPDERTVRQLSMSWGATPHLLDGPDEPDALLSSGHRLRVAEQRAIRPGDLVVLLFGSGEFQGAAADTVRLVRIP